MMKAPFWLVAAICLAMAGASLAGSVVDLDHAVFRANDSLAYVEIFASVQRDQLSYTEAGDSARASFMLKLDILQDSNVVLSDTFSALDVVPNAQRPTRGQFFPHVFRFIMKPGSYSLRAALVQGGQTIDSERDTVGVRAIGEDSLSLSDVELGCRMEQTSEPSPFVKNGLLMLPNPTRFYGTDLPLFYYYAEVYGLAFDSTASDSISITHRILHGENGSPARPEAQRTVPVIGASQVLADGFPVSTLRTGTYVFELAVTSLRTGETKIVRKKFWTSRRDDFLAGRAPEPSPEYDARMLASAPDIVDVIEPDSAVRLMKYILTKDQAKQAKRLNTEGKRGFVRAFWKDREIGDPGAANRYFARVAEANRRWDSLRRKGWQTDRGRVFILYGEPDLTDRNYADPSTIDNEVWHYDHLEGGVVFVFSDTKGFGDMELVHSTKRGEVNNPTWYSQSLGTRPREGTR